VTLGLISIGKDTDLIGLDTAIRKRRVVVVQLLAELNAAAEQALFDEVERCMDLDRPCLVLDFAVVSQLSDALVYRLLCCLEEAMKRNGDIRLAGLAPDFRAFVERSSLDRLFEIYDSIAEAVNSFHGGPFMTFSEPLSSARSNRESESAA
jgi:anti-anti-sigma regulatory factor